MIIPPLCFELRRLPSVIGGTGPLPLPRMLREGHHLHFIRALGAMSHLNLWATSGLKRSVTGLPNKLAQPAVRGVPLHAGMPEQRYCKGVGLHR